MGLGSSPAQAIPGGTAGGGHRLRGLHRQHPDAAIPAEIRPTAFNYPIALRGLWHGSAYRFLQRWRLAEAEPDVAEFEMPFCRLVYRAPDRFDLHWFRHTGQWWPLKTGFSLAHAVAATKREPLLQPIPDSR